MATPADQRLLELVDKWLNSLELHLKYSSLSDDSYSTIQPWPTHQRPSRWILDLAKQKATALKAQVEERVEMGDTNFSESLELMGFLANLVGVELIERFIPLANADTERTPGAHAPGEAPVAAATGTREMLKFVPNRQPTQTASASPGVARTERNLADDAPSARGMPSPSVQEVVIADAARLVQWGRKWYELAELISSMADRPSLIEVRRILKDNKSVIDKRAGRT